MALLKKKNKKAKPKKPKKAKAKAKKPSGGSGVAVEKPGLNVYTVMLLLSLLAITIACILLYMELGQYGGLGQAWK